MSSRSPFPGIDPYLEAHWGDVHQRLVLYACDALQPGLPGDLRARVGERLIVESGGDGPGGGAGARTRRAIIPDVTISEPGSWRGGGGDYGYGGAEEAGGVAVAESVVIELDEAEYTEGFIEIREARGEGRLVTAIEFLSPANKLPAGGGRDGALKYLQKQQEVLAVRANLVEVDLVRAGGYVLAAPEERVPPALRRGYLACVTTFGGEEGRRRHELFPLGLRRPLPVLPVPLRPGEAPVSLDLPALLAHAYAAGRYDTLDYAVPLDGPPLAAGDAEWVAERLARGGRGLKPPVVPAVGCHWSYTGLQVARIRPVGTHLRGVRRAA